MAGYRREKHTVESRAGEKSVIIAAEGVKVPSGDARLTVGEVEKLTGIPATKLRYYDKIGLLCPTRTGENVANNRKLYDADDLGRLQAILTLAEYDFTLEEIKQILDDEDLNLPEAIDRKLLDLRRRSNRLRHLVFFVKFISLTDARDADLVEGLACGPATLDELADLARDTEHYKAAITRLEALDHEARARAFEKLDDIMFDLFTFDEASSLAGASLSIAAFLDWWSDLVMPLEEVGYLGFWATFEDHGLIAERIEASGNAGDAGMVQMLVFFTWMAELMKHASASIVEVARLADSDVIAALEEVQELIDEFACAAIGRALTDASGLEDLVDLAFCVSAWMINILTDEELCNYLGLSDLAFALDDIDKIARLLDVIGSEG
jgi:DNA-binding transcriptional MerR regulator